MTPEEIEQIRHWIDYGLSDEMIGANWHQNCLNHGHNPPAESPRQTGERLRLELRRATLPATK
jgi:hypothetical protein